MDKVKVAILGGGDDELQILSEFHNTPGIEIIGVYDRDSRAVALEIAEIIGVPTFTDSSFVKRFLEADYVVVAERRDAFIEEIELLRKEKIKIINPNEAIDYLSGERKSGDEEVEPSWPRRIEEALNYIMRITDRERLLKWLLEISVRSVGASSGSIMLYSDETRELYIGYATGLSTEIVKNMRQKLGDGIAGNVAITGKIKLINDIVDTPLYKEGRERRRIQSAISAPLIHEGKLYGVINVSTDVGQKQLTHDDIWIIDKLSQKIAPILEQHMRISAFDIRETEFEIRRYLESLFHNDLGFNDKFTLLARFLNEKLEADTVTIYTATDEGAWLILGGSDSQVTVEGKPPRIHCDKGTLAKAYLENREIILTEARQELTELKIKKGDGVLTTVYVPLKHSEMLGVLVIEFSGVNALDRFLKMKETLKFQTSLFTYSQIKEVRQERKLKSLEELSLFTPDIVSVSSIKARGQKSVDVISRLVSASMGSLHLECPDFKGVLYYNFNMSDEAKTKMRDFDYELAEIISKRWEPVCESFISSSEVETYDKPPAYSSIVAYPLFKRDKCSAVYIGYNKIPKTPLDSSVFGDHELSLLDKVGKVLKPIFAISESVKFEEKPLTFDELLVSNQKLLIDRLSDEVERSDRYHFSFTVTLFKIYGLKDYIKANYKSALSLINRMSLGIRSRIRKTDYFSWIESDTFAIVSIESFKKVQKLEGRIIEYIVDELKNEGVYNEETFYPSTGYASYPGRSESPAQLINEAKKSIK